MEFRESFAVRMDNHKKDDYRKPIAFMKSLGLKCDSVGWADVQLDAEEDFSLVDEMKEKAKAEGAVLRCLGYKKEYIGKDAEWFYFKPRVEAKSEDLDWDSSYTWNIKGYKLPKGCQLVVIQERIGVSQEFVDACRDLKLSGVDFMWVTDKGRFDAPPYFYILPEKGFCRYTIDYGDEFDKPKKGTPAYEVFLETCTQIDFDGSHMSKIAETFHKFEMADLPKMLDQKEVPDTDFAYVGTDALIRRSAAEVLIARGILKWADLAPVVFFDEEKHDRLICTCEIDTYMPDEIRNVQAAAYEKWKKKKRPVYEPKEKDAIKQLRTAKQEIPESYTKALKKVVLETLVEESVSWLAPYYKVSNGGSLNNEIDFLPYEEVEASTTEFLEMLREDEKMMADMPELEASIVFASAANGDSILLKTDGSVMRYDHEDPCLSNGWESLHHFFFDVIEIE